MVQIDKDRLLEFLNKIKINGGVKDAIFDFNENGMEINAHDVTQISCVNSILYKNAFSDYSAIGKIGISELDTLISIIAKFSKDIKITVNGHLLTIQEPGKTVEVGITDINTIFNTRILEDNKFEFIENVVVDAKLVNTFLSDVSINSAKKISILTQPSKLILKNDSVRYKFTKEFDIETAIGGVKVSFDTSVLSAIKAFKENVLLKIGTGMPMKIEQDNDLYKIQIWIAPIMD